MATRWHLPDRPLRGSVIAAVTSGIIAVAGVAWALRASLHLSAAYPLKATGLFALVMLGAIGFARASHPFPRFGPANQITTARMMVVALGAALIGEQALPAAAMAAAAGALVAAVLDGVDGWMARRTNMRSNFGARFDMEVDALLIMVLAVLTWQHGKAGPWVLLSGLLRYLFVAAGSIVPRLRDPLPPSRRRQTTCVIQIAALIAALLPATAPALSARVAAVALAILCSSFLIDILWLCRRPGNAPEAAYS
jgi:phosphatidylglycerophosphate synthase